MLRTRVRRASPPSLISRAFEPSSIATATSFFPRPHHPFLHLCHQDQACATRPRRARSLNPVLVPRGRGRDRQGERVTLLPFLEISHSTWLFARADSHAMDRLLAWWREACEMQRRGCARACVRTRSSHFEYICRLCRRASVSWATFAGRASARFPLCIVASARSN